jgi:glutathione S-transferase
MKMGTVEGFQPVVETDEGEGSGRNAQERPKVTRLYGTTTSPYTRKIRILLRAAGVPIEMVDTRTDDGAGALARIAPLGKVPVIETDGLGGAPQVIADSGLIAAWLWAQHAPALRAAGFIVEPDAWEDRALTIAVEGALDAAINRFYLLRDKLPDQGYVTRQGDRVQTTLAWLDAGMPAFARPLTAASLSLGCALDWIVFRAAADLSRFPRLTAFREAWTASGVGAGTEPG